MELFSEKLISKASEFNNIPCPILLNYMYWKKRISTVLQIGNVSIISEGSRPKFIYIYLFDQGGGNLHRDCDTERALES